MFTLFNFNNFILQFQVDNKQNTNLVLCSFLSFRAFKCHLEIKLFKTRGSFVPWIIAKTMRTGLKVHFILVKD